MLQTFQYENHPISFDLDGEVMINATQMARPFPMKRLNSFSTNKQTLDFAMLLQSKTGIPVLTTKHGGKNNGTWMHQKLALKFAAWLSPEFELWVYDRIEELLTTGKTEIRQLSKEETIQQAVKYLMADVEALQEQNRLLEGTIQEQAPMVAHFNKCMTAENSHLATHMAQMFGLHPGTFNKLLMEWGILDKVGGDYKLKGKYMTSHRDCVFIRPVPITNSLGKTITKNELRWTEKARPFLIEEFGKRGYKIQSVA